MRSIPDNRLLLTRHERAVRLSTDAVRAAAGVPLTVETPCAGWDLSALLDHMSAQNRGFAAAASGSRDPAVWEVRSAADPIGDYLRSANEVVAAVAESDADIWALPEIPPGRFPAPVALGFHLIDSVVHAWDVARAIGRSIDLDHDLAPTALSIAEAVPIGASRLRPDAAFAPALDVTDLPGRLVDKGGQARGGLAAIDATATLDRILRILGRSPEWTPGRP